eukprot:GDKJ01003517.1.p1 GENE.GDKJ01003517.1~~GDKJ01003517.1.p1  ORF type:complete len:1329 (+),score=351.69 GDKJ01003517.1:60-4046(+)
MDRNSSLADRKEVDHSSQILSNPNSGENPVKRNKRDWLDDDDIPNSKRNTFEDSSDTNNNRANGDTPVAGSTPLWGSTPVGATQMNPKSDLARQAQQVQHMNSTQYADFARDRETYLKNKPWTDDEIDEMLPSKGYEIVPPPVGYEAIRKAKLNQRGNFEPPPGFENEPVFNIQGKESDYDRKGVTINAEGLAAGEDDSLPTLKAEDLTHFSSLLRSEEDIDEENMTAQEISTRKVQKLLLQIKNGIPAVRKVAMREITQKCKEFGAATILDQLLPLLLSRTLDDLERHVLVKVLDRVLFKLGDAVRPFASKIVRVMSPGLDSEDRFVRAESREVLANLSKAVGCSSMIATIRVDAESADEQVRNNCARTFAVVASTLSVSSVHFFILALSRSSSAWNRHSAFLMIRQTSLMMGSAVLPSLPQLTSICIPSLSEEQDIKVRNAAISALGTLAEACSPYGLESFTDALPIIWMGMRVASGRQLNVLLRTSGALLGLMEGEEGLGGYIEDIVKRVICRNMTTQDEDLRRTIVKVLGQISKITTATKMVAVSSSKPESSSSSTASVPNMSVDVVEWILKDKELNVIHSFFENFWTQQVALDRRMKGQVMSASLSLSARIPFHMSVDVLSSLLRSAPPAGVKLMSFEFLQKILTSHFSKHVQQQQYTSASTAASLHHPYAPQSQLLTVTLPSFSLFTVYQIPKRTEQILFDSILHSINNPPPSSSYSSGHFHSSSQNNPPAVNAIAALLNLGIRSNATHYIQQQLIPVIQHHLAQSQTQMRHQAACLLAPIAPAISLCVSPSNIQSLIQSVYELLGEAYPDVLGALLKALHALLVIFPIRSLTAPPPQDLLPRLVPILKNRHELVQEPCIKLIGFLAKTAGDMFSPREWDRVCFDLLEVLKSPLKRIRQAAIHSFGHIARAIGPHDVMATLLSNLKVQERQLRVCTTVAISIVAQACGPYTVLPALLNEYKVPDQFVRNGVLKSLVFLFEHIGEAARDYTMTVVPLLEDALMDRDPIHRQTASWAIKHLAIGVANHGMDDAMIHLLNLVWPNLFETTAHLTPAFFDAFDAFRLAVGPGVLLQYIMQGLFHPAQRVRTAYWRVYNHLYLGNAEQLVAFFPPLPADSETVKVLPPAVRQGYLPIRGASSSAVKLSLSKPLQCRIFPSNAALNEESTFSYSLFEVKPAKRHVHKPQSLVAAKNISLPTPSFADVTLKACAALETRLRLHDAGTTVDLENYTKIMIENSVTALNATANEVVQTVKQLPNPAPRPTYMSMMGTERSEEAAQRAMSILHKHLNGGNRGARNDQNLHLVGKKGEFSLRTYERSELFLQI